MTKSFSYILWNRHVLRYTEDINARCTATPVHNGTKRGLVKPQKNDPLCSQLVTHAVCACTTLFFVLQIVWSVSPGKHTEMTVKNLSQCCACVYIVRNDNCYVFPTVQLYCAVHIPAWHRMIAHHVWWAVQFPSHWSALGRCSCTNKGTYIHYLAQPLSKVAGTSFLITLVTYKLHTLLLSIPVETPKGTGTVPYP